MAALRRKHRSSTSRWVKNASTINNYIPREDNTAIKNFIIKLKGYLPTTNIEISVSGLTSPPRRSSERSEWISIIKNSTGKYKWLKEYKVGLSIDQNSWSLHEIIKDLRKVEPYSTENYYDTYLQPIADKIHIEIKDFVYPFDNQFSLSAGLKSNGKVSAWIKIKLPICVHDAIVHCGNYITEYPKIFLDEFGAVIEKKISTNLNKMIKIYKDYDYRYKFFRSAEQSLRKKHGVPLIGEGHITQAALYNFIKKTYPNAKQEHSPSWLGMQRFDIYIPNLKLAVEYNGPQHYLPIDLFGGVDGLVETQKRDDLKRKLSAANNVTLYEWSYTRPVNDAEVKIFIEELENGLIKTNT